MKVLHNLKNSAVVVPPWLIAPRGSILIDGRTARRKSVRWFVRHHILSVRKHPGY